MYKPPAFYQLPTQNLSTAPALSSMQFANATLPELPHAIYALRQIQQKDLSDWFNYLTREEVRTQSSWQLQSALDLQEFLPTKLGQLNTNQFKFAIVEKTSDTLIGSIGFHSLSVAHKSAEIGYDLSPAYWGKGLATLACQTMTSWAHTELKLIRIQGCVLDSNLKSQQVLERSDFQREGLLRQFRVVQGVSRDYWVYGHTLANSN